MGRKILMERALVISGGVIFLVNYLIGWSLKLKIITMRKQLHQIIFSGLLLNLTCLLYFADYKEVNSFLLISSLFFLLILPFGKKGGAYHVLVSTTGILIYTIFMLIELNLVSL
jgi:hypothetical protein